MTDQKDSEGNLLPDGERLTTFGKFLRSTSLDELPALINILRGDISIVGPRPLLVEYLSMYTQTQKRRHDIRPGITGWAQVNGRNNLSWKEKIEMDIWYVDNITAKLDFSISIKTIANIISKKDVADIEAKVEHKDFLE